MPTLYPLIADASAERVSEYARLFAVVASLLGAFMLAIILIGYLRRRRLDRQEGEVARARLDRPGVGDATDAWMEAGRREVAFTRRAAAPADGNDHGNDDGDDEGRADDDDRDDVRGPR